jgi:hypothetical protein
MTVDKPTRPLSVVIATLGGATLAQTIARLNSGHRVPAEILICIPEREAGGAKPLERENVRVVATSVRGQVAQRAEGFRQATQPFVMQLDDDMDIAEGDVQLLLDKARALGPGNAVAPIFLDEITGECIHRQEKGLKGFLQNVNAVMSGASWGPARMGTISAAGTNFGVDQKLCPAELFETQWLPGGCVVHHRAGLVTDAFYPQPGKAFGEDMMHSHLLKARGIRLWVVRDAVCRTSDPIIPLDLRTIRQDTRARMHFNRMRGGGGWRFWAWLTVSVARRTAVRAMGAARAAVSGRS